MQKDPALRMARSSQESQGIVFKSFLDFYRFYLTQHSDRMCRRMHFMGSALAMVILIGCFMKQRWEWLPLVPIVGYGMAWSGHFLFEKNQPATFNYPVYSLLSDFRMFLEIATGRIAF